jgi:GT2 family glycosyltransferase
MAGRQESSKKGLAPMDSSIIIVSWNTKQILSDCLQSVSDETKNHDAEIIVVDNASSDGSPELVTERFPHVKLIRNGRNLGFAGANNIGIEQSNGKYVFFINSDVIVQKGCLGRLMTYMTAHPEIGILGPRILDRSGMTQRSCMQFPTLWNTFCCALALHRLFPKSKLFGGKEMTYWPHNTIRQVEVTNGCFWMVRREALGQVGPLDETYFIYGEDIDWCKRFHDAGWKVVFFPGARAIHFGGASSSNAPIRFYIEMQRANLQFWRKHHSRFAQAVYFFITLLHQVLRVLGHMVVYLTKRRKRERAALKVKRSLSCIFWLLRASNNGVKGISNV